MLRWIRYILSGLLGLIVLAIVGVLVFQQVADGPVGPLAGGSFSTGEVITGPVTDWSVLQGEFEFELEANGRSRTAGGIMLDDAVYISCDLGFIWGRLPDGQAKQILRIIWWFKDWHELAQQDGRVRIRKDGKIYPVYVTLEQDPETLVRLKEQIEFLAADFFAPNPVGPRPVDPPNDILFFKVGAAR